jgi:hypothetical protein
MQENEILQLLTPTGDLPLIFQDRAYRRGWGFSDEHLKKFMLSLKQPDAQKDDNAIFGVDAWIGHDLQYNIHEAMHLMGHLAEKNKLRFHFDSGIISKIPQYLSATDPSRRLGAVKLDFSNLSQPHCGIDFGESRLHCIGVWTIAANPMLSLITQKPEFNSGLLVGINDLSGRIIAQICVKLIDNTIHVNDLPLSY